MLTVAFLFAAVIGKLIYIQIVSSEDLQVKALDQWTRDVPLTATRGGIYDRSGILLAGTDTVYTVYVRPNSVKNKEETAKALAAVFCLDYEKTLAKVQTKVSEVAIVKNVDKASVERIKQTDASGVYISQEIKRTYPFGDFMSSLLGFTDYDGKGQTGIEAKYNEYLQGADGYILTETDLVGRELSDGITRYVEGTDGANAYLTIDYHIQAFAEEAVQKAYELHNPKSVSCVIMDVNTGAVLAMAEEPSFDLNNVPRDDVELLMSLSRCTIISDVYELGSTFKILTAGIGLDTGAVTRNTTCYCPGYHIVDGERIKCWRTIGHGSQTFDQGVANSCNVLFMNTALAIGADTFYAYLDKLGIGFKTGIDLFGEGSGLKIAKDSVKTVDLARIGFRQAIAVTPIELITASAAIVNGGRLVTPYVVDRLETSEGKALYRGFPSYKEGVVKESTSVAMREILEGVVKNGGGKNAYLENYRIGGKTGTAQKYENGAIARGKYISTFIGFAPADNPKYIALFIVDEPTGGAYYGSVVAAPFVGEIYAKISEYAP